ncbi:MAG: hypothetical protein ACTSUS_00765 [Candidatus Freyarchaeota archaeon]|nr:hypothetical protein [Candidatus Freyrarchaeum guaymaensis]
MDARMARRQRSTDGGLAGMIADGWIPMAFSTESYRGDLREVEW